jgi:hypothetical protein
VFPGLNRNKSSGTHPRPVFGPVCGNIRTTNFDPHFLGISRP